ncbi:MAG: phosphate transport regulator [Flaviaesturariibacter sp.]|nr:phosphate transport regulator [Flaviaesturariibacter sp.]
MAFSFMKMFSPKDKVFYSLFEEVAANGHTMALQLAALVAEPDYAKRQNMIKPIEDLEHANDELTHRVFTELGRNFITPFDREDIHFLASALDDIADYIYASAKKIKLYHVNPTDDGIQRLAELIVQSTSEVKAAVAELRDMKNIRRITDSLVRINSIENQADDISDMFIERLFSMEPDAKEIIKKREIYQVLEDVTDKCEDAANVIESIIVKYA